MCYNIIIAREQRKKLYKTRKKLVIYMKKFEKMNEEIIELNGEVEKMGIIENEDGLFELTEKENTDAFEVVDVIYENGTYYVDYNETSKWADSNIIIGSLI